MGRRGMTCPRSTAPLPERESVGGANQGSEPREETKGKKPREFNSNLEYGAIPGGRAGTRLRQRGQSMFQSTVENLPLHLQAVPVMAIE